MRRGEVTAGAQLAKLDTGGYKDRPYGRHQGPRELLGEAMQISARANVAGIYRASGYAVTDAATGILVAERANADRGREQVAIAFPLEFLRLDAAGVLAEIKAYQPNGKDRLFVVALPKNTSLGAEFQGQVRRAGGELRNYAGLLDGGYGGSSYIGLGSEDRRDAERLRARLFNYSRVDADLLSAVVRSQYADQALATAPTRVQQRFFMRDGARVTDRRPTEGTDLLHHLVARLGQPPSGPEVYLIVGPGGAGKTWLFEGLFTYLYEAFQRKKAQQDMGVRPIPVMPESLIAAGSRKTADIFEAVAATEYGATGGLGLLDHLVCGGRNILMFDGLDEFFADNQDIGQTLSERYLKPGSLARIFIVLRDSLLVTSANVRTLVSRLAEELGPESFLLYELALWDRQFAQREMAWLKLEKRRPQPGERDTPAVAGFLEALGKSKRMHELARLAFYCDLLVDLYVQQQAGAEEEERSGRQMPEDEYDLLDLCFNLIVDRELAKQRPDAEVVPEKAFVPTRTEGPEEPQRRLEPLWRLFEAGIERSLKAMGLGKDYAVLGDKALAADSAGGTPYLSEGRYALVRLIEEAAYFARRSPGGGALTGGTLRELYAKLGLGQDEDDRELGERMLRQFVLFVQGREAGTVDFAHEFMADFLAARHVLAETKKHGLGKLDQMIGLPNQGETEVFRGYLKREGLLS
jgi:hypothetical protein